MNPKPTTLEEWEDLFRKGLKQVIRDTEDFLNNIAAVDVLRPGLFIESDRGTWRMRLNKARELLARLEGGELRRLHAKGEPLPDDWVIPYDLPRLDPGDDD
jgi:hypothetical protein